MCYNKYRIKERENEMNFKETYESNNQNWRDKVGSRQEMNDYIAYMYSRDKGQSHEEAMTHAAKEAQKDAKFKRLVQGRDLPQAGPSNK
jgi:hypothetical protein